MARTHAWLSAFVALALVNEGLTTEDNCRADCSLPLGAHSCPFSAHPAKRYADQDLFDLASKTVVYSPCNRTLAVVDSVYDDRDSVLDGVPGFSRPPGVNGTNATASGGGYYVASDTNGAGAGQLPVFLAGSRVYVTTVSPADAGAFNITLSSQGHATPFVFYGVPYDDIHVGTDGYIFFGSDAQAPPSQGSATLQGHFAMPRVSALLLSLAKADSGGSGPLGTIDWALFSGAADRAAEIAGGDPKTDEDDWLAFWGTADNRARLVVQYTAMYGAVDDAPMTFSVTLDLATFEITVAYSADVVPTQPVVAGLSRGDDHWYGLYVSVDTVTDDPLWPSSPVLTQTFTATDFGGSQVFRCAPNPSCTAEDASELRPIGPTPPPSSKEHPWAVAQSAALTGNMRVPFCEFGCSNYFSDTPSIATCFAKCDATYAYNITVGYSDLAEVARYECRDGCDLANRRCQPGYYCDEKQMRVCPAGRYRDYAYTQTTTCVDCPTGRWRSATQGRYMDTCSKCPAGTYVSTTGATDQAQCLRCPAGTHGPQEGLAVCIDITTLYRMQTPEGKRTYHAGDPEFQELAEMRYTIPFTGHF